MPRNIMIGICGMTVILLSGPAVSLPPNVFTHDEGNTIEAVLKANISGTNAAMVIGLVDESGSLPT
jgi:hypothetical protein